MCQFLSTFQDSVLSKREVEKSIEMNVEIEIGKIPLMLQSNACILSSIKTTSGKEIKSLPNYNGYIVGITGNAMKEQIDFLFDFVMGFILIMVLCMVYLHLLATCI